MLPPPSPEFVKKTLPPYQSYLELYNYSLDYSVYDIYTTIDQPLYSDEPLGQQLDYDPLGYCYQPLESEPSIDSGEPLEREPCLDSGYQPLESEPILDSGYQPLESEPCIDNPFYNNLLLKQDLLTKEYPLFEAYPLVNNDENTWESFDFDSKITQLELKITELQTQMNSMSLWKESEKIIIEQKQIISDLILDQSKNRLKIKNLQIENKYLSII
jgi:hypothetical protein